MSRKNPHGSSLNIQDKARTHPIEGGSGLNVVCLVSYVRYVTEESNRRDCKNMLASGNR